MTPKRKRATADQLLMRATEITGRPVVSITEGEALADVKDVLYAPEEGRVTGFTLNKRGGLFSGPMKSGLALSQVHAVGRHAVMVASSAVLDEAAGSDAFAGADKHRNVIGNEVLTDGGDVLGTVTDLVVVGGNLGESSDTSGAGDVVGYQVTPTAKDDDGAGHAEFVPLPYALAVSGTHLVVPAGVRPFITSDLSGFGGAVDSFRAQLGNPPVHHTSPGSTS